MLYRIDFQHFLSDAIDYFTTDELLHFKYLLISGTVANLSKQMNVTKGNRLYPTTDIIELYESTKNKKVMEEMYNDLLAIKDKRDEWIGEVIYISLVNPVLHHQDIVIVCDKEENDYIDVLCKHLKKVYALDCIDLNKLFTDGKVGPLFIDRNKIHDKAVDIRRAAAIKEAESIAATKDGRMSLLEKMNTKEKILKLKELGIKIKGSDKRRLNELLIDAWVNDQEGD